MTRLRTGLILVMSMPLFLSAPFARAERITVDFPPLIKEHTLASMRLHLEGLAHIQSELAQSQFSAAAATARHYLGMNSSMNAPNMQAEVHFMPPEMKRLGAQMHHAAEAFAESADNAVVTHDQAEVLTRLAEVTQACVACHAAYRLK